MNYFKLYLLFNITENYFEQTRRHVKVQLSQLILKKIQKLHK
jgi:hypothetical protein